MLSPSPWRVLITEAGVRALTEQTRCLSEVSRIVVPPPLKEFYS